jgi:hypothetical protein
VYCASDGYVCVRAEVIRGHDLERLMRKINRANPTGDDAPPRKQSGRPAAPWSHDERDNTGEPGAAAARTGGRLSPAGTSGGGGGAWERPAAAPIGVCAPERRAWEAAASGGEAEGGNDEAKQCDAAAATVRDVRDDLVASSSRSRSWREKGAPLEVRHLDMTWHVRRIDVSTTKK